MDYISQKVAAYGQFDHVLIGLAGGADAAYIFEEKFGVQDLMKVISHPLQFVEQHSCFSRSHFVLPFLVTIIYTQVLLFKVDDSCEIMPKS